MTNIETSILIKAEPKKVWEILMDFDKYPEWNQFIPSIKFKDHTQDYLELTISPPNGNAMNFVPRVINKAEAKLFSWKGKLLLKGIFDGHHSFELKPQGEHTLLVHSEKFNGILVPFLKSTLETKTRNGFILMNEALKERAETN